MFLNILIPTDGSALARSAVEKAVAFARDANATVTFVTVIEPFHVFSVENEQLSNTREEYRRLADAQASQFLTMLRFRPVTKALSATQLSWKATRFIRPSSKPHSTMPAT